MCFVRYVARQILPIAAEINATTRKVTAVQNKSPPVRNHTRIAANAAMGKANRKPITTIATNAIIYKMISSQRRALLVKTVSIALVV